MKRIDTTGEKTAQTYKKSRPYIKVYLIVFLQAPEGGDWCSLTQLAAPTDRRILSVCN